MDGDRRVGESGTPETPLCRMAGEIPGILWSTDCSLRITSCWGAGLADLGLGPNQLVGRALAEYFRTEDLEFPPIAAHHRALKGETVSVAQDWQGKVYQARIAPLRDDRGRIVGCTGMAQDVTEQKRLEAALRQGGARARALLNAPTDAVYLIDMSGRVVDANQTGARMLNRSVEQLIGTSVYELLSPEVATTRREKAEEVVCTGKPLSFEDERNGRFFDSTVYPILDRDGKVIQVAVSARDITERKRVEQALRESKERYLTVFEQAADSIVLVDPDTGALVEFNDRAHQSLGYTRSEFETLTIADLEVLESAEQVAAHLRKLLDRGSDVFETKHRTKAGEIRDIQVSSKTISAGGREFVQSTWRDVTEQKRAGEALKRAHDELENRVRLRTAELMSANQKLRQEIAERERAEQALRESERRRTEAEKLAATGRLAARVAHEINNPLAGILSSLQLVKAAVPKGHRHYEYAELIEKEIGRIGRIVRQMLLVHRPDQETIQDVHVVETIDQVVAILAPNCRDRRLRVETRADPSEITIRIPEGSLRQILYNLLANPVEASPPGGTINIGASILDGGNAVEITVADPGEGIPEDVQDRIFEPFFTTKEGGPSGNVGLGLSISKGIIDSLGGALDFETTPGEGTTFRVVLPSTDR